DIIPYNTWKAGYLQRFSGNASRFKLLFDFDAQVWQRFFQYRIPIIELVKDTPKEAVCQVFEKVNTGGVALTVFELVTATFAADDFRLRQDWDHRAARLHKKHQVLADVDGTDFLTSVTLCSMYRRSRAGNGAVGCKRKDI